MNEFRTCDHCVHFVPTGMDGECHLEGPRMPGEHGTSQWPPTGREQSCGQWVANLDWFVRQIEESREAVTKLIEEKEELEVVVAGLSADLDRMIEYHGGRKSLPLVDEQETQA